MNKPVNTMFCREDITRQMYPTVNRMTLVRYYLKQHSSSLCEAKQKIDKALVVELTEKQQKQLIEAPYRYEFWTASGKFNLKQIQEREDQMLELFGIPLFDIPKKIGGRNGKSRLSQAIAAIKANWQVLGFQSEVQALQTIMKNFPGEVI